MAWPIAAPINSTTVTAVTAVFIRPCNTAAEQGC
ncbi:hypothetical protein HNR39_002481 [Glaciimonas immobilis]|uniref:Uncharacterized protein n=1 Tax=Glaciimonas immobilis TaxID=728004 RepID=A0A840RW39_9BURK|nr:hypothetical protein [Glaciimonas immobilis]